MNMMQVDELQAPSQTDNDYPLQTQSQQDDKKLFIKHLRTRSRQTKISYPPTATSITEEERQMTLSNMYHQHNSH